MKIREFAEEIRNRISGKIEDVLEIKIKPVLKNNSKKLTAFVFKERVLEAFHIGKKKRYTNFMALYARVDGA